MYELVQSISSRILPDLARPPSRASALVLLDPCRLQLLPSHPVPPSLLLLYTSPKYASCLPPRYPTHKWRVFGQPRGKSRDWRPRARLSQGVR